MAPSHGSRGGLTSNAAPQLFSPTRKKTRTAHFQQKRMANKAASSIMPVDVKMNSTNTMDAPVKGAGYVVFILTMMNLLNYLDRIIPSVVKDLFKTDLKLTDAQTSLPITGF